MKLKTNISFYKYSDVSIKWACKIKIPKWIYNEFYNFDYDRSEKISQKEIDSLVGNGTIFDISKHNFFKVSDEMDISLFIKENRLTYGRFVQYTDNEYSKGRKLLQNSQLISTDKKRKVCNDNNNSIQVEQGEFAVKKYSDKTPSLQTYNIRQCVAVSIYDKATKCGFLAHIDNALRADYLQDVLKKYNFNPETSECRIIGGYTNESEGTVETIDEILKKFNLQVVEYDVLGDTARNVQLNLKTGKVYDYKETNPTYDIASGTNLIPNKDSE